eukprot:TRINITY_DN3729_c0_g1_i1.p1 TRINITY_DN3729_c0_g1~~TRINITY_DN3729_c0_g1_i1.p1  ORF type:complete len:422 (+),score=134.46 TRINITY_DN3729_c0_g1_i1:314-1579(+)
MKSSKSTPLVEQKILSSDDEDRIPKNKSDETLPLPSATLSPKYMSDNRVSVSTKRNMRSVSSSVGTDKEHTESVRERSDSLQMDQLRPAVSPKTGKLKTIISNNNIASHSSSSLRLSAPNVKQQSSSSSDDLTTNIPTSSRKLTSKPLPPMPLSPSNVTLPSTNTDDPQQKLEVVTTQFTLLNYKYEELFRNYKAVTLKLARLNSTINNTNNPTTTATTTSPTNNPSTTENQQTGPERTTSESNLPTPTASPLRDSKPASDLHSARGKGDSSSPTLPRKISSVLSSPTADRQQQPQQQQNSAFVTQLTDQQRKLIDPNLTVNDITPVQLTALKQLVNELLIQNVSLQYENEALAEDNSTLRYSYNTLQEKFNRVQAQHVRCTLNANSIQSIPLNLSVSASTSSSSPTSTSTPALSVPAVSK